MFEQVKLSYSFAALEPHIDALTMETHYSKHHATYTKNFNAAVEAAGLQGSSAEQILFPRRGEGRGEPQGTPEQRRRLL